jgi:hypothetical protein
MADVTTQQLAQLLLGIARAQNAFVEALENSKAGFRATHFRPAIESASRIRANRPDTLTDYPTGPDADTVQRDLERLLAASAETAAAVAAAGPGPAARFAAGAAAAPENPGGADAGDDNSLDMTR